MPTVRPPTKDELDELIQQGIDPSEASKPATFYSPEEMQVMAQQQQVERAGMVKGGIIPTIKSHAGALVGGGLAGSAGMGLVTPLSVAAAPETFGASLLIPPLVGAVTGFMGSKVGDVAQKRLIEPKLLGMTPETQQQEQQAGEMARQVYPKTALATDIVAGALAGGGRPSLTTPKYAAKGLLEFARAPLGTTSPVYRRAMQNVVTGGALNAAIDTGTQLATTGTVDPKQVAASAAAGVMFSEPTALGRKLNPHWKPSEPMKETANVEENITPDGLNIAEAEANRKVAAKMTADINAANTDYIKQRDAIAQRQEEQYQREQQEVVRRQQVAEQWGRENWMTGVDTGTPLIGDTLVKKEFVSRYKVDLRGQMEPEQRAIMSQRNAALSKVPTGEMRQRLYEDDYAKRDPQGYEAYKTEKDSKDAALMAQMARFKEAQQQQASQQPLPPPSKVIEPVVSPPTTDDVLGIKGSQFKTATTAEQPAAEETPPQRTSPAAMEEARKANVNVGNIQGTLRNYQGQVAEGVSYDPKEVGRRLIGIARSHATGDTEYHELVHVMLRDLDNSGDPAHKEMANAIRAIYKGGEEPAATAIGKRYQDTVEQAASKGLPWRIARYFKDVWAATKIRAGAGTTEDLETGLVAQMRQRHGEQDVTQAGMGRGEEGSKFSSSRRPYGYWVEPDGTMHPVADTYGHNDKANELMAKKYGTKFEGESEAYEALMKKGWARAVRSEMRSGLEADTLTGLSSRQRSALRDYGIENNINVTHYVAGSDRGESLNEARSHIGPLSDDEQAIHDDNNRRMMEDWRNELSGGSKFKTVGAAPPEKRLKVTQAAIDRIAHDIPTEDGQRVAKSFYKVEVERQNLIGKTWNRVADAAKGMGRAEIQKVDAALYKDVNDKTFSSRTTLTTPEQRKLYDNIRKAYRDIFTLRQQYNEPVYRNGKPTPAQQDLFYHATTPEPKVAETFRQGTDTTAIDRLSRDFIAQYKKHGFTETEARQELKEHTDMFKGSVLRGGSNDILYNANRKAQGIPLPESWRRQDLMRNLEVYFRRAATDLSWFHNVENDHKTMAALGYKIDPWHNPIDEPGVANIAHNDAVRAVVDNLNGERMGTTERTAHAMETLSTVTMLGPLTEIHKTFSSVFKMIGEYADNPLQSAQLLTKGMKGMGEAWMGDFHKMKETGYIQMDGKQIRDMLNTHLTMAERLQGLNKAIRSVYTLNGLTEHFTKAFLHSASEYLVPVKLAAANRGDAKGAEFMRRIDPDYQPGKSYTPEGIQTLASEVANQIHGTKDARTLPAWMLHDNEVSAFFKLSSWNIAQTNNFMKNVYTPATRGEYGPLLMSLFGGTIGGLVIKELREKASSKKSAIPSLAEIAQSERGVSGNIPALAYNWMAAASYAGFAGMLTMVGRLPFDVAFKNIPQGATFPLDEVVSNTAKIVVNASGALMNDPSVNIVDVAARAGIDLLKSNVQLARIGINHMADAGVLQAEGYRKGLADKMGDLRRWKMAEGLPFEAQTGAEGNPYMNIAAKKFKQEQDLGTAAEMVPTLISDIIKNYGNNPEVMLEKFKGLKQNGYESFPSLDDTPMAFTRYLRFLQGSKGVEAATSVMMDYLQHKMVNETKAGMIP